jgi:flagellar hook-associated protein 3 FlgL
MTGSTVTFGGATNNDQQMTITGTPAAGDSFTAKPRPRSSTSWTARSRIKNASSGASARPR